MIPDVVHAPSVTCFFLVVLWYGTPICCTLESLHLIQADSLSQQSILNPGRLNAAKSLAEIMCEVKRVEKLHSVKTAWNCVPQWNTRSLLRTDLAIMSVSFRNLAIGIGIQNFPEGLAVSLPLRGSGMSTWRSFWWVKTNTHSHPKPRELLTWTAFYAFSAKAAPNSVPSICRKRRDQNACSHRYTVTQSNVHVFYAGYACSLLALICQTEMFLLKNKNDKKTKLTLISQTEKNDYF